MRWFPFLVDNPHQSKTSRVYSDQGKASHTTSPPRTPEDQQDAPPNPQQQPPAHPGGRVVGWDLDRVFQGAKRIEEDEFVARVRFGVEHPLTHWFERISGDPRHTSSVP